MTGKFYKTLALNKAVEHVPSEHDLLFLFDLHIDVPADIMDSIRKVRLNIYFNPSHNSERQSATQRILLRGNQHNNSEIKYRRKRSIHEKQFHLKLC